MAFDTTLFKLQLKFANIAETSLKQTKPRHHVRRISFSVNVILADEVVSYSKLSAEDQELLNWQARTEDLQEPLEVRKELFDVGGRLCPCKNISLTFVGFVSDEDTKQQWTGERPLSEYPHFSFRTAMLTKHFKALEGQSEGQPELLALHDGLGSGDHSGFRWRSHDFMKLRLREQKPFYQVFWLSQWDVVDVSDEVGSSDNGVTNQGRRRRSNLSLMCLATGSKKFRGVRKRKASYIAEIRPKGDRKKIWLGSFQTPEAAGRAADAGFHYYDRNDKLNFLDSPQYLKPVPLVLSDKSKEKFVKNEAKRLAKLTEMRPSPLPSTWYPGNRTSHSPRTVQVSTELQVDHIDSSSNSAAHNMQPTNGTSFDVDLLDSDGIIPRLITEESNLGENLSFQLSTSSDAEILQEAVGSWPGDNELLPAPTINFDTANSHGGVEVWLPDIEEAEMYQHDLISRAGACCLDLDATCAWPGGAFVGLGYITDYESGQGAELCNLQSEPLIGRELFQILS